MKYYLQTDPEYCNEELVPGVTIKDYGCYFCCICTLAQIHPLELLKKCRESEYCFTENGLLRSGKVGSLAGIPYIGSFTKNNDGTGIVEILHQHSRTTHFIVQYLKNKYFDPLNGVLDDEQIDMVYSEYNFRTFRLFDNIKEDWIAETRKEGMALGITNGDRMEEPMLRVEGVKMCLNLLKQLKNEGN